MFGSFGYHQPEGRQGEPGQPGSRPPRSEAPCHTVGHTVLPLVLGMHLFLVLTSFPPSAKKEVESPAAQPKLCL